MQPPAPPATSESAAPQQLPEDYSNFDIVRAAQYGVLERCMQLIDGGCDVNQPDAENVSVLHWAAINNRLEIVRCATIVLLMNNVVCTSPSCFCLHESQHL